LVLGAGKIYYFMKQNLYLFLAIVSVIGMVMMSGCNRPETYTVTFNSNGGSGTMAAQTFTEDEAQTLTLNAFTYEGHTFASWNTIQDGSGTSYTDGQTITATADMTLYAQWTAVPQRHEYVDLGLPSGTLWATCNVGANAPEVYGDYFAWGETAPKETYDCSTYRYCNGSENTLTKYCNNANYGYNGFTDTLNALEATDDVAIANWGSDWRMPTYEEFVELKNNCTKVWTTLNGVNGNLLTGPNGNSIFLPVAGCYNSSGASDVGIIGHYLSSSFRNGSIQDQNPWCFFIAYDGYCTLVGGGRYYGFSVRPVCASQN
jgi:hypothetical protein